MKKLIQIWILLIAFQGFLEAQPYLKPTAQWYVINGDAQDKIINISTYSIIGDTTFNNQNYFKVLREYDQIWVTPFSNDTIITRGIKETLYLREDSGKFYQGDISTGPDWLIIDFNVEVGDTIAGGGIIDSMEIIDIEGEPRKVFYLSTRRKIYEGIGTSNGLFAGLGNLGVEGFGGLLCYKHNSESYSFEDFVTGGLLQLRTCDSFYMPIITSYQALEKGEFKIFPNPATAEIIISNKGNVAIEQIKLFAIDGRELHSKVSYRDSEKTILNLNEIAYKGIIIIWIKNEKGNFVEKIIRK